MKKESQFNPEMMKRLQVAQRAQRGFNVNVNATIFDGMPAERVADFLDYCEDSGINGVSISPGYAYERAPDQEHFLSRRRTKDVFRDVFRIQKV